MLTAAVIFTLKDSGVMLSCLNIYNNYIDNILIDTMLLSIYHRPLHKMPHLESEKFVSDSVTCKLN